MNKYNLYDEIKKNFMKELGLSTDQTKDLYEERDEEDIIKKLKLEDVERFYNISEWKEHKIIDEDSHTQIKQCFNQIIQMNLNNIAPEIKDIMRFTDVHPDQISAVIIGQDPYPGLFKLNDQQHRYACGYSFAVEQFVPIDLYPKSLKNITQSILSDFDKILKIKTFKDLHDYMFLGDPETTKYYAHLMKDKGLISEQAHKDILQYTFGKEQLLFKKQKKDKEMYEEEQEIYEEINEQNTSKTFVELHKIDQLQCIINKIFPEIQKRKKYKQDGSFKQQIQTGLLMMNVVWTVEIGKVKGHKDLGWKHITENIIRSLSKNKKDVVYLLFGNDAKKMKNVISTNRNYIIEAPHPSPVNAIGSKIFVQNGPFLKCFLTQIINQNKQPIDWWK